MLGRPPAPLPWSGKQQGKAWMGLEVFQTLLLQFQFLPVFVCFVLLFKGFRLVEPKGRAQYNVPFILHIDLPPTRVFLVEGQGAPRLCLTWPCNQVKVVRRTEPSFSKAKVASGPHGA